MLKSKFVLLALIAGLTRSFSAPESPSGSTDVAGDTNAPVRLPPVTVVAQKQPGDAQAQPLSVTAVTQNTLHDADITAVKDASIYAPNSFLNEFSARKLSNPFFRGVGGSPLNPAITTFIDGVPQLNSYSSSIELIDVEQIEFVRGPQGALFGRNTAGGVINITSGRPSLTAFSGGVEGNYGNYNFWDVRALASGPVVPDKLGAGVGIGFSSRDGYTKDQHGNTVDDREALFGKGQLIWVPCDRWEVRFILSGERARDGDYALNDLAAVRANPFHVSRTFEGFTHRDLIAPTLLAHYSGERADADIITGLVWWKTEDLTDLDYTALPLITRDNKEKDLQFTEELRVASAKNAPLVLSDNLNLKWQSGIFFFTQNYEQNALNSYAPGLLYQANQFGPGIPPVSSPANSQHAPDSKLDDIGGGVFGQLTLTAWDKLDFSAGVRGDFEHKHGNLKTFFTNPDPFLPNSPTVDAEKDYADASPQFSVAYRFVPDKMVYATVARGFRAGGFNPTAPTNNISYGEEHTWNYEAGFKTSWLDHRLVANFAAFYIDWSNLQFNEANPVSPGSFFIANAGGAVSKGVEAELKYRVLQGWDLFGSVGYTEAKFRSGSTALNPNLAPPFGANQGVGGNRLPYTPRFNGNMGTELSWSPCTAITLYGRAEVTVYGDFEYDASNAQQQTTYSVADFRAGARGAHWFLEGWVNNAFDTHYVPIAIPYGSLASSGYIAEPGAPLTFGLRAGLTF